MAGKWQVILSIMILGMATLPLNVTAYNSSGIEASEAQVTLSPSGGLTEGDTMTIYLTLSNTLESDAFNVEYAFYKNNYTSNEQLAMSVVDIFSQDTKTVSTTWEGLLESDSRVWVVFEYPRNSGNAQSFFIDFDVAGLPNLRVIQTDLTPSTDIHSGDTVQLSTLVKNTGSQPAEASILHLDLPSSLSDQELATSALNSGQQEWINTTFIAPQSGSYSLYITPDYNDVVIEASENNKVQTVSLIVDPRMDIYHYDNITITSTEGALQGPWTVSGKLARTGGSGITVVPMWLEIAKDSGGIITAPPFDVTLQGSGYAEQSWTYTLNSNIVSGLSAGGYLITAQIDPFNDPSFLQETTSNDRSTTLITLLDVPDVLVDFKALPSTPQVNSGDRVTWQVTITNTGGIEVSGKLEYQFEGLTKLSSLIVLPPSGTHTWMEELPTAAGKHIAEFEANWLPSQGSWDSNPSNNVARNNISVEANLRLNWATSSLVLSDNNGDIASFPLLEDETYTIAINLSTQELGGLSFDCLDGKNKLLSTTQVNVTSVGQKVSLQCQFLAKAPLSSIQLVPSDSSVTTTFTRQFSTTFSPLNTDSSEESKSGTMTLIGFGALILVTILGLAVWFTRETEEEVERDIFEYCPACDGELEGTESRCTHCSFNLVKARKKFHQCHECDESVPDLMDNCPYCGAQQEVSSFFEKRERRVRKIVEKTEVSLPDEGMIVSGTENFAETVKEFGYGEDELEDEWDENIATAEAELEAALDRRYEGEISVEDMTPEEIEEMESRGTTTLKSMKQMGEQTQDLDEMLAAKGDLISHKDDGSELTASDAEIRGRLYDITGEKGIMPGDKVNVGMSLSNSALAGNEIEEINSDFTVGDDDEPIAKIEKSDELSATRQQPKRREKKKTAECGACSAQIPIMAKGCPVCGAEFE